MNEPLDTVPLQMRPDRSEVVNLAGSSQPVDLADGVSFEGLVGESCGARGLSSGIVSFRPSARLPYHKHPQSESITLLEGTAMVEVEGRCYTLGVLDNIVVPRDMAHQVSNISASNRAVFHVAFATESPTRTLVTTSFPRQEMPELSPGKPGAERLNWHQSAQSYAGGDSANFIDYFNHRLMPGIEMSGGYALFEPGGRLPCHIHDFDESICIIQGTATCVVDGRQYTMSNHATAFQPRGKCHYFINNTDEVMAMIWVYAGPLPERIEMCESACTNIRKRGYRKNEQ